MLTNYSDRRIHRTKSRKRVAEIMPVEIVNTAAILALSMTILFFYHKSDDKQRWEQLMAQAANDHDELD
jgi:hypothetical protein